MIVAVLGATSKTGRYVVAALCARGHAVTAIGRDPAKLDRLDPCAARTRADIADAAALRAALARAECVASLAHARFTAQVLAALPESCRRVVLTGSLRKETTLPDPAADAVREGERLFLASGRAGVMLHPSMIYGAPEERNINRVLALLARFPRGVPIPVPLPEGGRTTVQPVFVDDMVAAMVAAIEAPAADGPPIAVAGPSPITYRDMVETCAAALGRHVIVVPVPLRVLTAAASLARRLRLPVPFDEAELARSLESKAFDITPMMTRLGVRPRPFAEGVRLRLARGAAELDAAGVPD